MKNTLINEELIIRYFSGNSSEEDRRTLFSWLNESPENEQQLFLLKDIYDAGITSQLYDEAQTNEGWLKLQKKTAQIKRAKTPQIRRPHWTEHIRRYAAILVIGFISGMLLVHLNQESLQTEEAGANIVGICEIKTEKGERVMVTLPDGSTVKLNACSYLSYPTDFGKETRQLQFNGEGYFDVQTNSDMPFVVQTSGLNIKAYGTTFNIKAYVDENVVETTLVKGVVTIENERHQNIVTLKPAQVVTIPKKLIATARNEEQSVAKKDDVNIEVVKEITKKSEQKAVLIDKIEPAVYTSWKDDRWIIKSESLESLAKKMERKYDVTFSFDDEASKRYIFSGTLKDYPLEQILEVVRLNAPIQYVVKEKSVTIREDKKMKHKFKQLIQSP